MKVCLHHKESENVEIDKKKYHSKKNYVLFKPTSRPCCWHQLLDTILYNVAYELYVN